MNTKQNIKTGKILALVSFGMGSLIFILFLFSHVFNAPNVLHENNIVGIGIFYVQISIVINGLFLLFLLGNIIFDQDKWKKISQTIGILLLNIPVAFLYFFIVLELFIQGS